MSTDNTISIIAQDGAKVTYDVNGRWQLWSLNDVYTGTIGTRKYVPKVGDWIVNPATKIYYLVTSVNESTLVSTYEELGSTGEGSFTDAINNTPNTFRVLCDRTVYPYALSVDRRYFVGGQDVRWARIFRGTSAQDITKSISMLFDPSGAFIDNKIPTELVRFDSHTNVAANCVPTCYTYDDFVDGDQVTVVFYDDEGHAVASRVMWVLISSWIPSQNADQRYVDSVSLQTPFLSESDSSLVEMPINVPVTAFNMFGIVHYSDGSQSDPIPVNSGKFKIHGLERFVGVYPGQMSEIVLQYTLDANEASYSGTKSANGKFVSEVYRMVTVEQRGAFSAKITGYPQWNIQLQEFKMRYFMTDLDRETMFEVTPYVYYNVASDAFDGKKLGKIQNLSIRVNMKDVSSSLPSYIHTQTMSLVLLKAGDEPGSNWKIAFDLTQDPWYGERLVAEAVMINQNLWRMNLRNGYTNYGDWINRVFYDSKPVYDIGSETKAPDPTHMVIFQGTNQRTEVPIALWNQPINTSANFTLETNIYIQFIQRTAQGDLTLGVTGMPVKKLT